MGGSLHHVGLTVGDLDRSVEFYELLGFEKTMEEPMNVAFDWTATVLGAKDASLQLMFLQLEGKVLELIQYDRPKGAKRTSLAARDAGAAHVAIEVDDVPAEHARLVDAGVSFVSDPIHVAEGDFAGLRAVYGYDPDGNTFELVSGLG